MPTPSQLANQSPRIDSTNRNSTKTFGMAKWRASQKARRQLKTIESEIDRKPYHFDEETWRSEDHTYTSYSQTDTTISRTEQSLSQETLDQVQMESIMPVQSITPAQRRA